jgi:hypothetical protein
MKLEKEIQKAEYFKLHTNSIIYKRFYKTEVHNNNMAYNKKGERRNTGRTHFKVGSIPWNKGLTWATARRYKKKGVHMYVHQFVWCSQPENLSYVPKGFNIHHLDRDKVNNEANNLVMKNKVKWLFDEKHVKC